MNDAPEEPANLKLGDLVTNVLLEFFETILAEEDLSPEYVRRLDELARAAGLTDDRAIERILREEFTDAP